MKAGFSINWIKNRHGRLIRAVALFFLIFTCADIALPQVFCPDEFGGLPVSRQDLAPAVDEGSDTAFDIASPSEDSGPNQPKDQPPHEEDCFCCCAHVLPGFPFVTVATSQLKSASAPPVGASLPSPPLRGTYHPPRFA